MRGTVAEFDAHRGYGTLRDDAGRAWFFHCTAIADGTRDVAVGRVVTFVAVAGPLGRWEAAEVAVDRM